MENYEHHKLVNGTVICHGLSTTMFIISNLNGQPNSNPIFQILETIPNVSSMFI